jgi:hypothetical protein
MPTRRRSQGAFGRGSAGRFLLVALLVVALGAAAMVVGLNILFGRRVGPIPAAEGCRASVGGTVVDLSTEQAENATLISAIAVRRGLPARAASIALATAFQESKLRNLDNGDRDSLGLFQQRPSQGWGTAAQIRNPVYATNRFYDALVKIDGYRTMRITEAAQRVQHSGFPEAYDDHAADGKALASALTGNSPREFSCVVHEARGLSSQAAKADGLTPRAEKVRRSLARAFGPLPLGGFAPGGVTTGHMKGSAHYDGRAVDVFVRPVKTENKRKGWAIAAYLVAHASRLHVDHVIFDDRIWSAGTKSERGWRDYTPPERSGSRIVLEHRDHVHVDVAAGG